MRKFFELLNFVGIYVHDLNLVRAELMNGETAWLIPTKNYSGPLLVYIRFSNESVDRYKCCLGGILVVWSVRSAKRWVHLDSNSRGFRVSHGDVITWFEECRMAFLLFEAKILWEIQQVRYQVSRISLYEQYLLADRRWNLSKLNNCLNCRKSFQVRLNSKNVHKSTVVSQFDLKHMAEIFEKLDVV